MIKKMYRKQAVPKRKIEKNISLISLVSSSFCEPGVTLVLAALRSSFMAALSALGKSAGIRKLFHRSSLKSDF
jgi:hypothetical protein